uniref:DZF domain-containing protein n=1 Tax=Ascaris lumbricoides TaxID=6252 RepID=A0A9J2PE41_ASCLU
MWFVRVRSTLPGRQFRRENLVVDVLRIWLKVCGVSLFLHAPFPLPPPPPRQYFRNITDELLASLARWQLWWSVLLGACCDPPDEPLPLREKQSDGIP